MISGIASIRDFLCASRSVFGMKKKSSHPLFRTTIGEIFSLERIQEPMDFESMPEANAILVAMLEEPPGVIRERRRTSNEGVLKLRSAPAAVS